MARTSSWFRLLIAILLFYTHLDSFTLAAIAPGWDYSLGIAPNAALTREGDAPGKYDILFYTTVLEYSDETKDSISDDQLFNLAAQAYGEMRELHTVNKQKCGDPIVFPRLPSVISALAIGKRVYISSTVTGRSVATFVYTELANSELTTLLNHCARTLQPAEENDKKKHQHDGRCAEILTIQQYLDHNDQVSPKDLPNDVKKRIAAWSNFGGTIRDAGRAAYPCNAENGKGWGCSEFLESLGIDTMDATSEKYHPRRSALPPRTDARPVDILTGQINIQALVPAEEANVPGS